MSGEKAIKIMLSHYLLPAKLSILTSEVAVMFEGCKFDLPMPESAEQDVKRWKDDFTGCSSDGNYSLVEILNKKERNFCPHIP